MANYCPWETREENNERSREYRVRGIAEHHAQTGGGAFVYTHSTHAAREDAEQVASSLNDLESKCEDSRGNLNYHVVEENIGPAEKGGCPI